MSILDSVRNSVRNSVMKFLGSEPEVKPEETNLTAEAAKRCLGMPEFKEYRDTFEAMERKIIDELIQESANVEDVSKFGLKCLVKFTRIRDLRALLSKVQSDARRADRD